MSRHQIPVEAEAILNVKTRLLIVILLLSLGSCFFDKRPDQPVLTSQEELFFKELELKFDSVKVRREINDMHLRNPEGVPGSYWITLEKKCREGYNCDTCYEQAEYISQEAFKRFVKDYDNFEEVVVQFLCNEGNEIYSERTFSFKINGNELIYQKGD